MRFSCPGKIFIAGEYACIEGSPALVCAVGPEFSLEINKSAQSKKHPFAELSPAGLYLAQHISLLDGITLSWNDPYATPIGVGSSSAQFLLSIAAISYLQDKPLPSAEEVLNLYWQTVGISQGLRPSGLDVVTQWIGGPLVVQNEPFSLRKLSNVDCGAKFVLAYTGAKAKTHEHLKRLEANGFPKKYSRCLTQLRDLTLKAVAAWEALRAVELGQTLNDYQTALSLGGLAPADFTAQIRTVQGWPGVLGCKGTGAQGGDCVLLLVESGAVNSIHENIKKLGWQPFDPEWTTNGLFRN